MKEYSYTEMQDMLDQLEYEIDHFDEFNSTQKSNSFRAIQVLRARISKLIPKED